MEKIFTTRAQNEYVFFFFLNPTIFFEMNKHHIYTHQNLSIVNCGFFLILKTISKFLTSHSTLRQEDEPDI